MPFKVKFQIFEPGKLVPYLTTNDARQAHAAYREHRNKYGCALTRMTTDIECIELTKPEQYVWLVYRVRQAIQKYYGNGRKREDLQVSLDLEKQLDDWNNRTRAYIDIHPGFQTVLSGLPAKSEKARHFAFFQVVEEWRKQWHKYFAYKKQPDKDQAVEREIKKQCFDFEKEIDKYIKLVIGL